MALSNRIFPRPKNAILFFTNTEFPMQEMKFSRRWRFKTRSSGLWSRVVMWWDINVSEAMEAVFPC